MGPTLSRPISSTCTASLVAHPNGVNTLAVNTHLIGRFATATTGSHTVDTFAHFEGVLMIINGIAAVQI